MAIGLHERLFWREQGTHRNQTTIGSIYGDPYWVHNLDIVNELGGHTGCVNALSWSKSGNLLASGSDDTKLLIHRYQPDGSVKPFSLSTEILTGHTANIFSVKFMPHSNDATLVTCAGDSEVRVFDVEYSARNRRTASSRGLGLGGGQTVDGVRHLSEGDTNTRVYRSHADRAKRIVTESSPFLFLTCSEDGEVRQWDLRLPSSAYPEPREGRMLFSNPRRQSDNANRGTVPPPLISYRRYRLDLNTISCSATQPHYIALGGAHLHCFLHDRRMIGRDLGVERGSESPFSMETDFRGDEMGKATRCVRRFAPDGAKKMDRLSNGHITACKISDANPNEMIVSWSGDSIYSFDLIHSPDANEQTSSSSTMKPGSSQNTRDSIDRKRKRQRASPPPDESASKQRRSRSLSTADDREDVALRVRYGNGQSEDISLETTVPNATVEAARDSMLTPSQKRSLRIAKSVVKIRRLLFSLEHDPMEETTGSALPSSHIESLRKVAQLSTKTLEQMDRVISAWRYPVDPDSCDVDIQTAMRRNRDRARRFVQAAGVIAQLWAEWSGEWESSDKLTEVGSPATEGPLHDNNEIFRYDFLKAILAWLKGGPSLLLSAFRERSRPTRQAYRFPVPQDSGVSAINRYLIRHLLLLACAQPVPDLDRNRFEHDATRQLFESERHAVTAFEHIVEVEREAQREAQREASSIVESSNSVQKELAAKARLYDPETTRKFWGFKVARGVLMNAAEGVDFALVDRAYGGLGREHQIDSGRNQRDIDTHEEDLPVTSAVLVRRPAVESTSSQRHLQAEVDEYEDIDGYSDSDEDEALFFLNQLRNRIFDDESDIEEEEDDSDDIDIPLDDSDEEDQEANDEDIGDEGVIPFSRRRLLFSNAADRMLLRESVDMDVPVGSHTRKYTGHCNVKTVKDVNFYGLNDEYVVSGSDSGHVFIWDRKTTKLLNILVGDGDIVNVIQGHPYEPMLAVSGIDNTIKIFSSDHRAQRDGRLGHNLAATQRQSESNFTTIGTRRFLRPQRQSSPDAAEPLLGENISSYLHEARVKTTGSKAHDGDFDDASIEIEDLPASRRGLASRRRIQDSYTITSQNQLDSEGSLEDRFISSGMLQQIAMRMRARAARADGEEGEDGDDMIVIDDDNCTVM